MKKIAITFALCAAVVQSANGQATVNFVTDPVGNVGPFVFDTDGVTKVGANIVGQIFAGVDAGNLAAIGTPVAFTTIGGSPNPAALGIIQSGTVNVTASGNAFTGAYQIKAWDGQFASYDLAVAGNGKRGASDVVTGVAFGGPQTGLPAATPPNVNGFQSFSLVPEPGTMTLGLLGLGGLIASRRRKNA